MRPHAAPLPHARTAAESPRDANAIVAANAPSEAPKKLPPYPCGWYEVGFSDELPREKLIVRPFMGQELLLLRTRSGEVAAMDAYCPHLGAHLGHGGIVEGEQLRCPFHGFRYDIRGTCVATGYEVKTPPSAQIRTWPLREVNGMLLAYYDPAGTPPDWLVPPLEADGWSRLFHRGFVLHAHPQETTENSVDLGHFSFVHGYRSVRMLRDVLIEGPYLSTAYEARRPAPLVGRWVDLDFEYETHIHGLGYSQVDVHVRGFDLRARLWVLPTPIDAERIALSLATSVYKPSGEARAWMRLIPRSLRGTAIAYFLLIGLAYDARQDFAVWENKRYLERPALARGDGPIGKYRTWASRFYA